MKRKISIVVLILVLGLITTKLVYGTGGTNQDPLVSLSYLNEKLAEIRTLIDQKAGSNTGGGSQQSELVVLELQNGQKLIGHAGSEIILRSGKASAIVSELGGISDVTSGEDIGKGKDIPKNHLLIIPRSDGRGILINEDKSFVLIRGAYTIEQ